MDAYPVGAIYVSTVATSPSELFGGTWEALEQGRVLIGQGTDYAAGSTGGEKEHAITTAEMPAHNHALSGSSSFSGSTGSAGSHSHLNGSKRIHDAADGAYGQSAYSTSVAGPLARFAGTYGDVKSAAYDIDYTSSTGSHSHSFSGTVTLSGNTGSKGSGDAISLMQPYLAVYMWKRVA